MYDKEGSCIFQDAFKIEFLLGILSSKITKYFQKTGINATVHSMPGDLSEAVIVIPSKEIEREILKQVKAVMKKQDKDPRYDYASHEQLEIDKLVYQAYGLTNADIAEVEAWYQRRYPRLGRATPAIAAMPIATVV